MDTEIEVSDAFLERMDVGKGLMTLVDEARQAELITALADEAEPHKQTSGGSACNTVVATRYFGGNGYYACKVADDATGDIFVNDLTAAGVDTNMNGSRDRGISGKCLVMLTPDAERTMNTFLGISSQVSEAELDEAAIAASHYVYLEGYLVSGESSRAAAIKLRQLAEKHGVKTSLTFSDPAMVQFFKDGLSEMLGDGVDLLFCNDAEATSYTDTDSPEAALENSRASAAPPSSPWAPTARWYGMVSIPTALLPCRSRPSTVTAPATCLPGPFCMPSPMAMILLPPATSLPPPPPAW